MRKDRIGCVLGVAVLSLVIPPLPNAVAAPIGSHTSKAWVGQHLLGLKDLTDRHDAWKQTAVTPNTRHQTGTCGVALPPSRYEIVHDFWDKASEISETFLGDDYVSNRVANRAVRLAYQGKCRSWVSHGATIRLLTRFTHRFTHTTAYCTTGRIHAPSSTFTLGQCRFVRRDVRFEIEVGARTGVTSRLRVLTARAVKKAYG
jgi:hypothetical protein